MLVGIVEGEEHSHQFRHQAPRLTGQAWLDYIEHILADRLKLQDNPQYAPTAPYWDEQLEIEHQVLDSTPTSPPRSTPPPTLTSGRRQTGRQRTGSSPSSGPSNRRSRSSPNVAAATAARRPQLRRRGPARTVSAPPAAFLAFSFLVSMNYVKFERIMYRLNETYLISS